MKQEFTYAPDLLKKMENIRNRYVKHWKTDFYWDVRMLLNLSDHTEWEDFTAVWLVRDCGTNLFVLDKGEDPFENELVKCVLDDNGWDNVRTYLIKGWKEPDYFIKNFSITTLKKPC